MARVDSIFACNTMPHSSTGLSPFYLMFGREIKNINLYLNETYFSCSEMANPVTQWMKSHQ